jgi:hypothetical protein
MQKEAFNKLYELKERVYESNNRELLLDFRYLQVSDHFYYMSTKFFSDGEVHSYFNPYNTPYEAFINYMNVLSDFKIRVDAAVPSGKDGEISRLSKIIKEKDEMIARFDREIQRLKKSVSAAKAASGGPRKGPVKLSATKTGILPETGKMVKGKTTAKTTTSKTTGSGVKKTIGTGAKKATGANTKTTARSSSGTAAKRPAKTTSKTTVKKTGTGRSKK